MQKLTSSARSSEALPLGPVVVLGDIMLDIYISGTVGRISPEAPVPVVLHTGNDERAGAAANVALNIAAIGGNATLLGVVGQDTDAQRLISLIEDKGVCCDLIQTEQCKTTTKTRIVSEQHHQFLRIDREKKFTPPKDIVQRLMQRLDTHLLRAKALILSDYGKGMLSDTRHASASCSASTFAPDRHDGQKKPSSHGS